jgi:SAM-dependent methyltransferase
MFEYRKQLYDILEDPENIKIYDFGGAAGPLLYGEIVDRERRDVYGRKVKYHDIAKIPKGADVIFTSHTLEHVDDLLQTVIIMAARLRDGGHIIAHVPSIHGMKYWHPVVKKEHKRIFCLGDRPYHDPAIVVIDRLLSGFFKLDIAEYCGDDCIMIMGRK